MATLGQQTCIVLALGLLALTWVMTLAIALSQQECRFSVFAKGKLPTSVPSHMWPGVASSRKCAQLCMTSLGAGCLSLGYSQEQRECRGYSVFNASDVTVASPGHKYYRGCPARVGDGCTVSEDCSGVANTECRYGTCQCVVGFHFYPGQDTCVAACPSGYGDGYYVVIDHSLLKNNIDVFALWNVTECGAKCRANPKCSSFEIGGGICYLQNATALQDPGSYVYYPGWQYGQMNCA